MVLVASSVRADSCACEVWVRAVSRSSRRWKRWPRARSSAASSLCFMPALLLVLRAGRRWGSARFWGGARCCRHQTVALLLGQVEHYFLPRSTGDLHRLVGGLQGLRKFF